MLPQIQNTDNQIKVTGTHQARVINFYDDADEFRVFVTKIKALKKRAGKKYRINIQRDFFNQTKGVIVRDLSLAESYEFCEQSYEKLYKTVRTLIYVKSKHEISIKQLDNNYKASFDSFCVENKDINSLISELKSTIKQIYQLEKNLKGKDFKISQKENGWSVLVDKKEFTATELSQLKKEIKKHYSFVGLIIQMMPGIKLNLLDAKSSKYNIIYEPLNITANKRNIKKIVADFRLYKTAQLQILWK